MGGFLGIGGSSAKTDRGNQLAATQADWNLFSYGLPTGQKGQATGTADLDTAKSTLGTATDYWRKLLSAGRTDTLQRSAPAVNQVLENERMARNAEGTFGTDRAGGTAAANREASTRSGSQIDDIINKTLLVDKEEGARGLTEASQAQRGIAQTELSNALSLLGLSSDAVNKILQNATGSRAESYKINQNEAEQYGKAIGQILLAFGI